MLSVPYRSYENFRGDSRADLILRLRSAFHSKSYKYQAKRISVGPLGVIGVYFIGYLTKISN